MRKLKKSLALIMTCTIMLNTNVIAFASSENESNETVVTDSIDTVEIYDDYISINGRVYTLEQFEALLDISIELNTQQGRVLGTLVAGTWFIPGIGEVIITAAGSVVIAGIVVKVGSSLYNMVVGWFQTRAEIAEAKAKIPSRLKDQNGNVKIGDFNQKVNGKTAYKEKGGWTIEKDTAGHGGRKWKLKDKSGERIASLDENGKVLSR